MKRKKLLAVLLSALMLLGTASCTKSAAPDADNSEKSSSSATTSEAPVSGEGEGAGEASYSGITLNVAHGSTGDVSDAFDAQFAAFEQLSGCVVEIEHLSSNADEIESVIQVRAATGNLPDVWQNSVGAKLQNISPQENIYDLSGQSWIGNLADGFREIVTDKQTGSVWAIPSITSNVAGVFYNKNVYNELGLEIPTTWEIFLANCETIKSGSEIMPCASPYSTPSGVQILFLAQYYYVQNENPDFANQYTAKEIELHESPAYLRGMSKMYDLYEKGYQDVDPLSLSFEDASVQLAEGKTAMLVCRTNVMATVQELAPDAIDNIGFFPLPDEDSSNQGVATWMPTGWVMSKNVPAENEACSLALLEYLTTGEAIDVYCTKTIPTGAFMLNGVDLPDNVAPAVVEAQAWVSKASTPVMEYFCDIKGSNMATILQMLGTGDYTPDDAVKEIEQDNAIDARQKNIAGW